MNMRRTVVVVVVAVYLDSSRRLVVSELRYHDLDLGRVAPLQVGLARRRDVALDSSACPVLAGVDRLYVWLVTGIRGIFSVTIISSSIALVTARLIVERLPRIRTR